MTTDAPARGSPLFSFAVVADTHINPDDDRSSSPWTTNRFANARAAAVVARLNELRPQFVVHLGDIVHPTPSQPPYALAADRFRALFADLKAPLHLVSGNHDVGDKPTAWSPAASITEDFLALFRRQFGPDWYAFDHDRCRFVVVNSQLMNSGLPDEAAQWAWLDGQLETDRRVFLFKHYPPFLCDANEDEHYDNLAEPARERFLGLLDRHRVEAVFCGHVHNYFYNRLRTTDCYVLPATSAVRHDYMELFPVVPVANDHGRDARSKLGFFWVDVHAEGHVAHWVRSWGETEHERGGRAIAIPGVHARGPVTAPLGVDLRHGWADRVSIPYTGVVDEFGRKQVRNDYRIAALWETGLRRLRVPAHDLVDTTTAHRVAQLAAAGHRFTVFSFGLPDERTQRAIADRGNGVEALEIIERAGALVDMGSRIPALRATLGVPVFLSKLRVSAETDRDERRFAHFIRHGFLASEAIARDRQDLVGTPGWDGAVFRVDRDEPVWATLRAIDDRVRADGRHALVHVRLAGQDPSKAQVDDADTAARVADAAFAAWAFAERLSVFLDTFDDHDRGYYPRHGLVDRACDPRAAAYVLRHLAEALHGVDRRVASVTAHGRSRIVRTPERSLVLVIPEADSAAPSSALPRDLSGGGFEIEGTRLDERDPVVLRLSGMPDASLAPWDERAARWPVLFRATSRSPVSA